MSDKLIECVLCRKEKKDGYCSAGWAWRGVCPDCFALWELGRKREKLAKIEGKAGHAQVILVVKTEGREGNPQGPREIKSADLISAMGAVKLKGTSLGGRFTCPPGTIRIGESQEYGWMSGGSELVQVPEARATAMKKIVAAFFNAITRARVDGFNEGRNLLAALSRGQVTVEEFSEASNNVAKGRRPR